MDAARSAAIVARIWWLRASFSDETLTRDGQGDCSGGLGSRLFDGATLESDSHLGDVDVWNL